LDWQICVEGIHMRRQFERPSFQVAGEGAPLRDPFTAAALSVVPGLGQLYNGDSTKGFLFIDVAFVNFLVLCLILMTDPLIRTLTAFSREFHSRPNNELLHSLEQMHIGTAVSTLLLALIFGFVIYAARDAYDSAKNRRLRAIYADTAIEISEAASGSYLFHAASIVTCGVLALFLIVPPPPATQITEIDFVPSNQVEQVVIKQHVRKVISDKPSETTAPVNLKKPVQQEKIANRAPREGAHREPAPARPSKRADTTPARPHLTPTPPKAAQSKPVERPVPVPTPRPVAIAPMQIAAPHTPAPAFNPHTTLAPAPTLRLITQSSNPTALPLPTAGRPMGLTAPMLPTATGVPLMGSQSAPQPIAAAASSGGKQTFSAGPSVGLVHTKLASAGPVPAPGESGPSSSRSATGPISMPGPSRADTHGTSSEDGHGKHPFSVNPVVGTLRPPGALTTDEHIAHDGPGIGKNFGGVNVDFGPYMAELQRRIKSHWFPTRVPHSNQVSVTFQIAVDGQLSDLKIYHSSGVSTVDQAALRAVQEAAPFRHLPPGAESSEISSDGKVSIEFKFDYNVFGGSGGGRIGY
jgi:TonB family protein